MVSSLSFHSMPASASSTPEMLSVQPSAVITANFSQLDGSESLPPLPDLLGIAASASRPPVPLPPSSTMTDQDFEIPVDCSGRKP
ncbi:hypothetical protein F2Q69_00032094 [Brassica cretica]|uniref:Uncharacterized protein n=1 Tax=Brassica cretica TaxID=69181 RepID=A0A8S9RW50_BRACR|nr:hypothetical protein F2Q69_00032094 [Brassica cretica]